MKKGWILFSVIAAILLGALGIGIYVKNRYRFLEQSDKGDCEYEGKLP